MDSLCSLVGDFDTGDWISLAAAVAAWLALLHSIRVTRHSHMLATLAHQRQEPSIELYLAKARLIRASNQPQRVYVFEMLVSNLSVAPNSIKRIELAIEYGERGQPLSHLAVPHSDEVPVATGVSGSEARKLPILIGAGETLSIVAQFLVAEDLLQGGVVESCKVVVTDTYDREVEQKSLLIWGSEQ